MRHWSLGVIIFMAFIIGPAAPACARAIAGLHFADTLHVQEARFTLSGVASYKKFGFPVLVAALWLAHAERDPDKILIEDMPRRYVTHFQRGVSSRRVCRAWNEGLDANSPGASGEVKQQFQTLCLWIHDFRAGDEIAVTYLPGRGSIVELDGTRVGEIPGKGFADAYFACALGPRPSLGKGFKKALLGGL
jgi:hypothetical protein